MGVAGIFARRVETAEEKGKPGGRRSWGRRGGMVGPKAARFASSVVPLRFGFLALADWVGAASGAEAAPLQLDEDLRRQIVAVARQIPADFTLGGGGGCVHQIQQMTPH
jgi:hypothetical protein